MSELTLSMLPVGGGTLAIASLPGRGGDYKGDMKAFGEFKPSLVMTMVTEAEIGLTGSASFGIDIQALGSRWFHLPVEDYGYPKGATVQQWVTASEAARAALRGGGRVLVHCKGGCGRSGMAVLRLMVEMGEDPKQALERLRGLRPCAVETEEQLGWAAAGKSLNDS